MNDDVASARRFMRYIDAFIEDVLAVDKKTGKRKSFDGLFGPVKAYYGMVETQGGGTLHAHFIIWLMNCPTNSNKFESVNNGPDGPAFSRAIEAYSSSIGADRNWSKSTVFVTPDSLTRTAINNEFVKESAKQLQLGQYPIRVVAQFSSSLSGLSRREVEYVMGLSDSRFGRMAPFIDLVEGMPVQVTQMFVLRKGLLMTF
ncbi:hypothetical protein PHMEG_00040681 [Phytophthora megakarya]|uniref:Helitron helicase-like domain-containing protein n=1 Tax=Phytophthora megakarya TaxID=4795 RepID=A0A225UD75_9STRA|nr:hypothetical protein PHMEG_00040681 [Phytophthora megakarya]